MIASLSRKVASKLHSSGAIEEADQALYEYALNVALSGILHLGTSIVLGAAFGIIPASLALFIPFILIRKFAGGFHASTPLRCYLFSVAMITLLLAVLKFVPSPPILPYAVVLAVSAVVICLAAPVDTKAKPLAAKEKKVFKAISILLCCILAALSPILYFWGLKQIGFAVCLSLGLEAFILGIALAGRLRSA